MTVLRVAAVQASYVLMDRDATIEGGNTVLVAPDGSCWRARSASARKP
jgi:hypothetical protein